MNKKIIPLLSASLAVVLAVAVWQTILNLQLVRQKNSLVQEKEMIRAQYEQAQAQLNEISQKREKELQDYQTAEYELRNVVANKDKMITEQESALKEMGSFRASLEQVKLQQADTKDWREAIEEQGQLVMYLNSKVKDLGMTIYRQDPYVVVRIPQTTFQLGSAQASPVLLQGLKVIAEAFNSYKGTYLLAVEGHTDNTPVKKDGLYKSNWELGAARSDRVIQNLMRMGVKASDIALVSRSEYMPVNEYTTPTEDEENRRVELVFAPRRMVIKNKPVYVPQGDTATSAATNATPTVQTNFVTDEPPATTSAATQSTLPPLPPVNTLPVVEPKPQ